MSGKNGDSKRWVTLAWRCTHIRFMSTNIASIIPCLYNVVSHIRLIVAIPTPRFIEELWIFIDIVSRLVVLLQFLSIANVFASNGFKFRLREHVYYAVSEGLCDHVLKLAKRFFHCCLFGASISSDVRLTTPPFYLIDSSFLHFRAHHLLHLNYIHDFGVL